MTHVLEGSTDPVMFDRCPSLAWICFSSWHSLYLLISAVWLDAKRKQRRKSFVDCILWDFGSVNVHTITVYPKRWTNKFVIQQLPLCNLDNNKKHFLQLSNANKQTCSHFLSFDFLLHFFIWKDWCSYNEEQRLFFHCWRIQFWKWKHNIKIK